MTTQEFTAERKATTRRRAIGPMGTAARVCTGLFLLSQAFGMNLFFGDPTFSWPSWQEMALGFVGFPAIVMLIAIASQRVLGATSYLRATGPIGTLTNLGIIAVLFLNPYTHVIAHIFYGVPMLLAAWRGYAGCEVLAISNFVLDRDDQLGCPWFLPVDWVETRLAHRPDPQEVS